MDQRLHTFSTTGPLTLGLAVIFLKKPEPEQQEAKSSPNVRSSMNSLPKAKIRSCMAGTPTNGVKINRCTLPTHTQQSAALSQLIMNLCDCKREKKKTKKKKGKNRNILQEAVHARTLEQDERNMSSERNPGFQSYVKVMSQIFFKGC